MPEGQGTPPVTASATAAQSRQRGPWPGRAARPQPVCLPTCHSGGPQRGSPRRAGLSEGGPWLGTVPSRGPSPAPRHTHTPQPSSGVTALGTGGSSHHAVTMGVHGILLGDTCLPCTRRILCAPGGPAGRSGMGPRVRRAPHCGLLVLRSGPRPARHGCAALPALTSPPPPAPGAWGPGPLQPGRGSRPRPSAAHFLGRSLCGARSGHALGSEPWGPRRVALLTDGQSMSSHLLWSETSAFLVLYK